MTRITDINAAESIRTGRLIFKRGWEYYIDKLVALILSAAMCMFGVILQINTKVDGELSGFLVYIVSPVLITGGLYALYRLMTENKLMIIKTGFSKNKNHKLLIAFLNKYQYHPYHEKDDIIIAEDDDELSTESAGFANRKEYTFIIEDLIIYSNAKKISRSTTFPSLFAHLILKHDLVKFIAETKD